jgi:hypothetical protein
MGSVFEPPSLRLKWISSMLLRLAFDEEFFAMPCFRLKPPVQPCDRVALVQQLSRGALFADSKIPASDLETARLLLEIGFHKTCVQVELQRSFDATSSNFSLRALDGEPAASIVKRLHLSAADIKTHAAHFATSRFRQDPLIPAERANRLYAKWIENSLSGAKSVAHIDSNFCSFFDTSNVRFIDLLSVLDKRRGYATALVTAILKDALTSGVRELRVVTEVENAAALAVYRGCGLEIKTFHTCFHLINSRIAP